ncbi:hypothetical protein LCGC14_2886450 [marine sediment metagenome]|uniref:Uncharacterized protein n=1 Tax=marine sediment metagenome TaxID=412755 RepID=A0A0F8YKC2_9ZZZZ
MTVDMRPRVRKTGPLVSNVAATTPLTYYQLSDGRSAVLVKILGFNGQAGNVILEIGDGLAGAFVRRIPRIFMVAGMDLNIGEEDCPNWEFTGDIVGQVSAAAAAAADVGIQLVVDEIG